MHQEEGSGAHPTQILVTIAAWAAFCYCTYFAIRFSGQRLLDSFSFRETQTALTSYWICKEGFRLAYQTPVAGAPWSIPFEFPLYQYIVSLVSCPFHLDLERVGRLISYGFLVACVIPAAGVMRTIYARRAGLYMASFSALFFSAPIYLYYGRSFMIETTALFFSLCFANYSLKLIYGSRSYRTAALAAVSLTFAILQKSTTVLPMVPVFGAWLLIVALPEIRAKGVRSRVLWIGIGAFAVPFALGAVWANYTDTVKKFNALGRYLTSAALMQWNFGTVAGRFSEPMWHSVIWQRNVVTNAGGWLGIAILLAGLIFTKASKRAGIICGVLLFIFYFMVFQNLHFVHEYYQTANVVFLVFSLAVAVAALIESDHKATSLTALVAFLGLLVANVHAFITGPHYPEIQTPYSDQHPIIAVANSIKSTTDASTPIVVFGDDWNSEIPFFSERKAFVVPQFFSKLNDVVENPAEYVGQQPSAVVVCGASRAPKFEAKIEQQLRPAFVKRLEFCNIFYR